MPVQLEWIQKPRILEYKLQDPFTPQDVQRLLQAEAQCFAQARRHVHILVDFSGVRILPPDFLSVLGQTRLLESQTGYVAVLGASPALRLALTAALKRRARPDYGDFYDNRTIALDDLFDALDDETQPQRPKLAAALAALRTPR